MICASHTWTPLGYCPKCKEEDAELEKYINEAIEEYGKPKLLWAGSHVSL